MLRQWSIGHLLDGFEGIAAGSIGQNDFVNVEWHCRLRSDANCDTGILRAAITSIA
jgi:hypothetical protein